ncbi:MAG TPA: potassium transporter TrkG [Candidatus Kapabacteria bacterium]|nr:potassium transporter TrkG [Candidatus Kapabacteria bacterium]
MINLEQIRERYPKYSQYIMIITGFFILVSLTAIIGFRLDNEWISIFTSITSIMLHTFIINELIKLLLARHYFTHIKERWYEFIIIGLLFFQLIFPSISQNIFETILPNINPAKITLIYIAILEIMMLFLLFLKAIRVTHKLSSIKIHSSGLLAISFLAIILIGSLLLYLPRSYNEGAKYSYIDALFTSTSCVCVTGLIVVDTEHNFTVIGKVFIILLIQVGGLGIMTLTTFFALYLTGGVSLRARTLVKDLISEDSIGKIQSLIKSILLYTFVIEAVGALLLYLSTVDNIFVYDPILFYHAIFHSISAFCNAGFSVFSDNLMNESIRYNYFHNSVIMALIVMGGLGFIVHSNLYGYYLNKRSNRAFRLKIHTKLVVISTLILIFGGTILIYIFGSFQYLKGLNFAEQVFHAMFWSVTARTAGFSALPMSSLNQAATLVMVILMWIGASPGSTGGGIKTTTLAIVSIALFKYIVGVERAEVFKREISQDSIKRGFFVILASIIVLGFASIVLIWIEPDKNGLDLIFEVTSALSTVGLSKDLTFYMGNGGKLLLITVMFIGRIGVLSFLMSFHKPVDEPDYSYPKENILVG